MKKKKEENRKEKEKEKDILFDKKHMQFN